LQSPSRGLHLIKGGDGNGYLYHYENASLVFGTNSTERMRIASNGAVSMVSSLSLGGALTLPVDAVAIFSGGNRNYFINNGPTIYWGYGDPIHMFRNPSNNNVFTISSGGTLSFANYVWHQCINGNARFYFAPNVTTYIRGHATGGGSPIEFRNASDTPIAWFNGDGEFTCMFETQSSTDTDHIIIRGNTGLSARGRYRMLIGHNTFTGFHRCYYEDDELFNNNMLKEEIDIFKNNYKGRIVISTGKLKTDFSRDIKKETIVEEVSVPTTQNEEDVKIEDITEDITEEEPIPMKPSIQTEETKSEWYSAIDKDGIRIEDAIPIVQVCRVKKDKRVYGVLGSPTRSINNINRLIVNSVGAIIYKVANC
jgi:hypothetical protein